MRSTISRASEGNAIRLEPGLGPVDTQLAQVRSDSVCKRLPRAQIFVNAQIHHFFRDHVHLSSRVVPTLARCSEGVSLRPSIPASSLWFEIRRRLQNLLFQDFVQYNTVGFRRPSYGFRGFLGPRRRSGGVRDVLERHECPRGEFFTRARSMDARLRRSNESRSRK